MTDTDLHAELLLSIALAEQTGNYRHAERLRRELAEVNGRLRAA